MAVLTIIHVNTVGYILICIFVSNGLWGLIPSEEEIRTTPAEIPAGINI